MIKMKAFNNFVDDGIFKVKEVCVRRKLPHNTKLVDKYTRLI